MSKRMITSPRQQVVGEFQAKISADQLQRIIASCAGGKLVYSEQGLGKGPTWQEIYDITITIDQHYSAFIRLDWDTRGKDPVLRRFAKLDSAYPSNTIAAGWQE